MSTFTLDLIAGSHKTKSMVFVFRQEISQMCTTNAWPKRYYHCWR